MTSPRLAARQVRIKAQACGICHSDMLTVAGVFPGIQYPRVPGHEVVGLIDAVGRGRAGLETGDARGGRLARRSLRPLRPVPEGRLHQLQPRPGSRQHFDGGYAEYMIAPFEAARRGA